MSCKGHVPAVIMADELSRAHPCSNYGKPLEGPVQGLGTIKWPQTDESCHSPLRQLPHAPAVSVEEGGLRRASGSPGQVCPQLCTSSRWGAGPHILLPLPTPQSKLLMKGHLKCESPSRSLCLRLPGAA